MSRAALTPLFMLKLMSTLTSVKESVSLMMGTWRRQIEFRQPSWYSVKSPIFRRTFLPSPCPELWWSSRLRRSSCAEPPQASTGGGSPTSQRPPGQCRWQERGSRNMTHYTQRPTNWIRSWECRFTTLDKIFFLCSPSFACFRRRLVTQWVSAVAQWSYMTFPSSFHVLPVTAWVLSTFSCSQKTSTCGELVTFNWRVRVFIFHCGPEPMNPRQLGEGPAAPHLQCTRRRVDKLPSFSEFILHHLV